MHISRKKILSASFLALSMMVCAVDAAPRRIKTVRPVSVSCMSGTVPRLPHQVWVSYSDGKSEFRQVSWTGSALAAETALADTDQHPAGSSYMIKGHVIGDETTPDGFPVEAEVRVTDRQHDVQPICRARPLPLADVTITGDNRLSSNRDLALRAICSWDVTQQLYNYRDTYGMSTVGYRQSDGWDSPDCKLKGHGAGHYLSAIAQAYAVTGNADQKSLLRQNIMRMVNEMRECQEKTFVFNDSLGRYWEARDLAQETELLSMKGSWAAFDEYKKRPERYGYGYLNAIPAQHCVLVEMYRPYNNTDWVWAPYYTVHKQLAGLIDIVNLFDDKATCQKAMDIARDMGLWVWNRMHYRTYVKSDGTQQERRQRPGNRYEMWDMYIAGEVGGIAESLSRLSEMVNDSTDKARLLEAANSFDAPRFFNPLSRNIDDIRTRHANQHIPMIIGALRSYQTNHNPKYYRLAENFWSLVQGRYAYATGGVGNGEMFRQPYTQTLSMATNGMQGPGTEATPDINETCCVYNLLKLTRDLNCYNPDDARYMDYYERALYNHMIGSLNPAHYQTCYQYAVGLNATKPFGNETPQSTCCGGTGSENHTKYHEAAYFASDSSLYVALYIPTTVIWRERGIKLEQDCLWPAETTRLTISEGKGRFAMKLRVPYWATNGFCVKLNGRILTRECQPSSYYTIDRRWKKGDCVEIQMPFTKHVFYNPDKLTSDVASTDSTQLDDAWVGTIMYGPLAMTGTGAVTWGDATLDIDSRLDNVIANKPAAHTGPDANLYTMTIGRQTFLPDYHRISHTTHYYRINHIDSDAAGTQHTEPAEVDKTMLNDMMAMAVERMSERQKWAPHGLYRLQHALDDARMIAESVENLTQKKVNTVAARLNKAINTMRPSNLAEIEDLQPLTALLQRAGKPDPGTQPALSDAVGYAEMVCRYVTDGSGTHDMIDSAIKRLKDAMK